jgi:septal ring factor EnvC (AmiA/AmiB activator)
MVRAMTTSAVTLDDRVTVSAYAADELEQARQQLRTAQRQTARLERSLDRATRTAATEQRRRDANHQRLANLDG